MEAAGGVVINFIIGKVKGWLGIEINYMLNYKENVDHLKREAQKVKIMRVKAEKQLSMAKENGDELFDGAEKWVENASDLISKVDEFLKEEAKSGNTSCSVNLVKLYHFGKKAARYGDLISKIQEYGKDFENGVSVRAGGPKFLELYQRKIIDDINTQDSAFKLITQSLLDESIQIIGIYGTGGVGKTTLAKEGAVTLKNNFQDVVFVVVSHNVDLANIGKEVETAAKRIMRGEKILIILDDMWKELELDKLGIPCGINHKNCKILLTSRSRDVCVAMNTQIEICVDPLPIKEAWILFKRVVGEELETNIELKRVAMKVVEECGGLPLILEVVGKALKKKSIQSYNAYLSKLKQITTTDIPPKLRKAFTHLQQSYDLLESEEEKSCFLLCSMFPEDTHIPLERLAQYGVGLNKFKGLDSLEDARNRVQLAVDGLKSSGLLLDGNNELTTKMHDVVRDVALLIASSSKDNNKFLVKAGKDLIVWQPRPDDETLRSYTGISLMHNNICKLPDYELHFPLLDILLLQKNQNLPTISDEFCLGVKGAKVIDIEHNNILSLPQTWKQLTQLCMLNLGGNTSLHEIAILGELTCLEILNLNDTGIQDIPQEIGQLVNLRQLQIKCCRNLSRITPGVISKLRWLEELYIGYYSVQEGNYNTLVELNNLANLKFLDLFVPDFDLISEGVDFGKLKGFVIQIGGCEEINNFEWNQHSEYKLIVKTSFHDSPSLIKMKKLVKASSDGLVLESMENLDCVMPAIYCEGFDEFRSIEVSKCDNLSCLMDSSSSSMHQMQSIVGGGKTTNTNKFFSKLKHLRLSSLKSFKVMWDINPAPTDDKISLNSLVTLEIVDCPRLVRLFTVNVAKGLANLQKLSIRDCKYLKEVIWGWDDHKDDEAAKLVFPSLVEIHLSGLNNLRSFFCSKNCIIKYPKLVKLQMYGFDTNHPWEYGTHDAPKLKSVNGHTVNGGTLHECYMIWWEFMESLRIGFITMRAGIRFMDGAAKHSKE